MDAVGTESYFDDLLRHESWARRLAFRLVRDAAAADDLVQEAFLAALHQRPEARASLRPWLAGVLKNLSRLHWRSRANRAKREAASAPALAALDPAEMTERLDTHRRLAVAVGDLSDDLKSVVVLRYYEDLNSTEIGRRLGIPPATVRWRLAKALSEIRSRFEREKGSGLLWVMPLLPLAAASAGAGDYLRRVASIAAAGASASATPLGSLVGSRALAWTVAAAGAIATVWLVTEVRHLTDRLEQRPPAESAVDAERVAELRQRLDREVARREELSRDLREARQSLAAVRAEPAPPPAETAAAIDEELMEKLRALALVLKEFEESEEEIDLADLAGQAPGAQLSDDPKLRKAIERRLAVTQKMAGATMPILEHPATADDYLGVLAKERDPHLMRALLTVISSKSAGTSMAAGRPDPELGDRLVPLFRDRTVDDRTKAMLLGLIDLGTETGRTLVDDVMSTARAAEEPKLRDAALGALAGIEDERALALLKQTAESDASLRARIAAVAALGARFRGRDDEEILGYLAWLRERADEPVLQQAIETAKMMVTGQR